MQRSELEQLARIRAATGYLGEKDQFGWWPSSFFAAASAAFVAPLFPRTQFLAQCKGTAAAAARLHDERIGVGQVYHLFRLPEDIEQALHRLLQEPEAVERLKTVVRSRDEALAALRECGGTAAVDSIGPTRVGNLASLRGIDGWGNAAAEYLHGFESETEVFPYFAEVK